MTEKTIEAPQQKNLLDSNSAWLQEFRKLVVKSGCPTLLESIPKLADSVLKPHLHIALVGGPNVGKSRLINACLARDILPTDTLSNGLSYHIEGVASPASEAVKRADNSAVEPLEGLHSRPSDAVFSASPIRVSLNSDWLCKNQILLSELAVLDLPEAQLATAGRTLFSKTDFVVITIDALAPLKRTEVQFLADCARRKVPTLVVLTKVDKVSQKERAEIMAYIERHMATYSTPIKVCPIGMTDREVFGIDLFKQTLTATIKSTDLVQARARRQAWTLLEALEEMSLTAAEKLEGKNKRQAILAAELDRKKDQLESHNLLWDKTKTALDQKCGNVDGLIRLHLEKNREAVLQGLEYDLEGSSDVKSWWERGLHFRLEREFKSIAAQLSGVINQQIGKDVKWLKDEIFNQFSYSIQAFGEKNLSLDHPDVQQNPLSLSDGNTLKIISQVGTAATVVMASTFLATAGIGGIALAAGAIAGICAEQFIRLNLKKDRQNVRNELRKIVVKAELVYAAEVSRRLGAIYRQLADDLKQQQRYWQQRQLQKLAAYKGQVSQNTETRWAQVSIGADALRHQIETELAT